jgi:MoCo/4Fe-4S cofactor protein with predicted Tat translocation signal
MTSPSDSPESRGRVLDRKQGREYWRSLEELADTPEFRQAAAGEFPFGAAEPADGMNRRSFVQLLGASIALAGLGGCFSRPREKILPYVSSPPELTPGRAQYYATSMVLGGYATGLLVESHTGRPTKIEGNPDHPASLGAAGVYEQASVLQLYDPHRARQARRVSWDRFVASVAPAELRRRVGTRGAGLRLLLEPTTSPLMGAMLERLRELYPAARVHFHAPLTSTAVAAASTTAFGRVLQPVYDFTKADVVFALDADFLSGMPFHLRYAHDFAVRRRISGPSDSMNRLYHVETAFSPTGSIADHRLRARPSEIAGIARSVLSELGLAHGLWATGMPAELRTRLERIPDDGNHGRWIGALAGDLAAHQRRSVVVAGERQPVAVQLLAHLLNATLGNIGRTVRYIESPLLGAGEIESTLRALIDAMTAGEIATLAVLEGNPSYNAPADLDFGARLRQVPDTMYLGLYENETAGDAKTFLPALHYLESWGDARAYDGTASLIQPLISPLYPGQTTADILAAFLGEKGTVHDRLRRHWLRAAQGSNGDQFWDRALQRGVLPETSAPTVTPSLRWESIAPALTSNPAQHSSAPGLELVFLSDPKVYDGSFAGNPWLQELPHPITKLTWGNAAVLSPATAARIGVGSGDMLTLRAGGRSLEVPALIVPGQADNAIALSFGYGRSAEAEPVARGVGVNAFRLWTGREYALPALTVTRELDAGGPRRHELATTQTHWAMEGRPLVLQASLQEYHRQPDFTQAERGRVLSLYQPHRYTGDQWAMVIDQSLCTGCGGCVVACQAENNIPVVGKKGVLNSREMHWLRIDRYLTGSADDPEIVAQPMLCQHCEQAPCEYVCPVSATKHSPDGLNEMIYNRCVGTRFCSNNCPYKVRRFNWFDYNGEVSETEAMVKNPDVTVRARGVMEKCTFCVQRIRRAEIDARIAGRPIRDGEFTTACAQACPTGAIVFGSISDPESEVARRRGESRSYAVLHELGTEPRVRYLARITNPNPALAAEPHGG